MAAVLLIAAAAVDAGLVARPDANPGAMPPSEDMPFLIAL
jgi:hypothetical protein